MVVVTWSMLQSWRNIISLLWNCSKRCKGLSWDNLMSDSEIFDQILESSWAARERRVSRPRVVKRTAAAARVSRVSFWRSRSAHHWLRTKNCNLLRFAELSHYVDRVLEQEGTSFAFIRSVSTRWSEFWRPGISLPYVHMIQFAGPLVISFISLKLPCQLQWRMRSPNIWQTDLLSLLTNGRFGGTSRRFPTRPKMNWKPMRLSGVSDEQRRKQSGLSNMKTLQTSFLEWSFYQVCSFYSDLCICWWTVNFLQGRELIMKTKIFRILNKAWDDNALKYCSILTIK